MILFLRGPASARGDEDASVGAFITSSRRAKAGLSGFVAYMRRKDAEVAVKELDGLDWGGTIIRVGWSKMVKIPLRPIIGRSNEDFETLIRAGEGD